MKKLLLVAFLLLNAGFGWSQEYTWAYLNNPDYGASNQPSSVTMVDGKLYHIYASGFTSIRASVYNPETGSWTFLNQMTTAMSANRIQTVYRNNMLYFVASTTSDLVLYRFNPADNTFATLSVPITSGMMNSNWQLKAGLNNDLYMLRVQNYSQVYLTRFDLASGLMTNNVDYSGLLNPSGGMTVASGQVELYISSANIYCGIASDDDRLGTTTQGTINTLVPYNTAGANNGGIYYNGALSTITQFYLVGDGVNAPTMHVKDVSAIKTWTFPVGNTNINAISTNTPDVNFNVYQGAYSALENVNYAYLMSSFQPIGGGSADKFYVYRQDQSSGIWDSIGPKIVFGDPFLNSGTCSMSLDINEQHMGVQWASGLNNGEYEYAVLNRKPYINPGSETPNSGICVGHQNEIYPQLEYMDEDNDKVRIVNVYSQFGVISNLSAVAFGHYPGLPSTSKFKIYGTFNSSANDAVIITYTDGWNQFNDTLPIISTGASAPNVTFSSSPLILCNNENLIDLANYVSYVDQGMFTLNGYDLPTSVIDGREMSLTNPNGTIYYRVSVGGCIVETGVTFSFVTAGTASTSSTTSACGSATGTADVIFTPGTSTNTTVEWSTGGNNTCDFKPYSGSLLLRCKR